MENKSLSKINTMGKVGYIISTIGEVIINIAVIACLVVGVLLCFVDEQTMQVTVSTSNGISVVMFGDTVKPIIDIDDRGIEIGDRYFEIISNPDKFPTTTNMTYRITDAKWFFFGAAVNCVAAYFAFHFAAKLCKQFKCCTTPFTQEISKGLMNLAWSLIPLAVISGLMKSVTDSIITGRFDFSLEIDLTYVLLVLCVFMLSIIFSYGAELQAQSDETL